MRVIILLKNGPSQERLVTDGFVFNVPEIPICIYVYKRELSIY